MITLLSAGVDPVNFIPWGFTLISVLIAIYSLVKNGAKDDKNEAKECAIDTTTVIVKLENIQQALNKVSDSIQTMQTKMESLDHRLTIVETQLKFGIVDPTKLEI